MAPTSFKQYQTSLAPWWARKSQGEAWFFGLGDLKDALEDRTRQAVKARFPSYCPPDALALIGDERQIEQGVTETEASYRSRLLNAWDIWPFAGTAYGVLLALYYAGYTNTYIAIANGHFYSLDGSLALVDTPATSPLTFTPPFWNTFRIIFPAPLIPSWSSVPLNASDEVNTIRRLVVRWKAGHAKFVDMVVVTSGNVWGFPAALAWGSGGLVWGGTTTVWDGAD